MNILRTLNMYLTCLCYVLNALNETRDAFRDPFAERVRCVHRIWQNTSNRMLSN
jgi:hypothetical protein